MLDAIIAISICLGLSVATNITLCIVLFKKGNWKYEN